jgi:ankyrin repeat protein
VKLGHVQVVRELVKLKNFPIDELKKNGVTAMGIASYRGSIEMMEIVGQHSDLNFTNTAGIGPMYLAIKGNKPDSIRYLLGRNVAIHSERPEKTENSPIFYAIR